MSRTKTFPNLHGLLQGLSRTAAGQTELTVEDILNAVGRRSFAPLLLITSIAGFTPLSGIPGVPTTLASVIFLISVQMVLGRARVWMPDFLLERKIAAQKLQRAAKGLQPAARVIDKLIRPRLTFLTDGPSAYGIAMICIFIALTVPPLELVPFVDMPLWGALVAFSLALAAHDGLLAIAAFVLTAAGIVLTVIALL
jgi:hypothetical protein